MKSIISKIEAVLLTSQEILPQVASESSIPTLSSVQKEFMLNMLERNHGNISKTAAQLGVARSTIYNKLKKYRTDNSNEDH